MDGPCSVCKPYGQRILRSVGVVVDCELYKRNAEKCLGAAIHSLPLFLICVRNIFYFPERHEPKNRYLSFQFPALVVKKFLHPQSQCTGGDK